MILNYITNKTSPIDIHRIQKLKIARHSAYLGLRSPNNSPKTISHRYHQQLGNNSASNQTARRRFMHSLLRGPVPPPPDRHFPSIAVCFSTCLRPRPSRLISRRFSGRRRRSLVLWPQSRPWYAYVRKRRSAGRLTVTRQRSRGLFRGSTWRARRRSGRSSTAADRGREHEPISRGAVGWSSFDVKAAFAGFS
ncbi:hypothetical protein GWI33_017532 [Rhynchophorus ferrugineus]|uniref:Uncharacterized protein n=1 Tax=Rhynchophorus ferrugineus TaxID=354439 RepID=A0A834M3M8_RHYFE|nr:hypothetical protein GWI33_017532 [Rhynchophorus ferrugineus]